MTHTMQMERVKMSGSQGLAPKIKQIFSEVLGASFPLICYSSSLQNGHNSTFTSEQYVEEKSSVSLMLDIML